jgi:hypothetical protein
MNFKKEKYFGEVWFFDKENQKQFCVLEIIDINYGKFNELNF